MTQELDLLAIGDVCIDLYMAVEGPGLSEDKSEENPQLCFYHGSKIPVRSLKTNIAGNAINVSMGAHALGLRAAIYAEMGDDEYAERIEQELEENGIITDYLKKSGSCQTGIHPIIIYDGERTIFSHHEERSYKLLDWPEPKWIYYTSISPGFESFQQELTEYMKKHPKIGVAFNPGTYHMQAGLDSVKNILAVTHVLFVNKDEAEAWVGKGDIPTLHEKLQELGPKLTIITEGSEGASGYDGTEVIKIDAIKPKKPVLDKTGAGDSFAAGALSALFYNKPLIEVLTWGALNASSVLTEVGAIHGFKTKKELEDIVDTLM